MNVSKILTSIKSMIPNEENLKNRLFYIQDGNIYFSGDSSEFLVEDIVEPDINIAITYSRLEMLKQLQNSMHIDKIDDYSVRIYDDKMSFQINTNQLDHKAESKLKDDITEGINLQEIYGHCSKIFDLTSDGTSTIFTGEIDSPSLGDVGFVASKKEDRLAVSVLNHKMDSIDFTNNAGEVKNAVVRNANMSINKDKLIYSVEVDNNLVYVSNKLHKSIIDDKTKNYIRMLLGTKYQESVDCTLKFKAKDFKQIMTILNKKETFSVIEFVYENNELVIRGINFQNESVETKLECTSNEDVAFQVTDIDPKAYQFVCEPYGGLDKCNIIMELIIDKRLIIISAESLEETDIVSTNKVMHVIGL